LPGAAIVAGGWIQKKSQNSALTYKSDKVNSNCPQCNGITRVVNTANNVVACPQQPNFEQTLKWLPATRTCLFNTIVVMADRESKIAVTKNAGTSSERLGGSQPYFTLPCAQRFSVAR